jgi:glutamyl-tRNA synthetase
MEGLEWLGLSFDEGPHHPIGGMKYRQSERINDQAYQPYIDQLLSSGNAYYCFETDEELAAERQVADDQGIPYVYSRKSLNYSSKEVMEKLDGGSPWTIRFRVPDNATIVVKDAIRGTISFESNLLSDFIIVRSDGNPTYNFAVVVDDHVMGITHVVRGEDHISNTPRQIMMYNAFGWDVPQFAHLPIILGPDRSKLSKRHGAKSVSEYRDEGFLPAALINYLSLLGWSPPDGKELLSRQELKDLFDISRINKAGAVFDTVKLTWMNKQYLAKTSDREVLDLIHPFVNQDLKKLSHLDRKILSVRDNIETLSQINKYLDVYARDTTDFFNKFQKLTISESDIKVIEYVHAAIAQVSTWNASSVIAVMEGAMETLSLGKGKVMKPMRKSITGDESGPNLIDCLALIPLGEIKARLELVLKHVNSTASN